MKEPTRSALKSAFFEAFFVILGVLLALGANEWRQNAAAEEQAEAALTSILAEQRANREDIQAAHDYHTDQVAMLRKKTEAGETPTGNDFPRGFIAPAIAKTS